MIKLFDDCGIQRPQQKTLGFKADYTLVLMIDVLSWILNSSNT